TWELLQEPQITLEEQLQVGHAVAQHRHSIDAEPERPAGIDLGIDPALLEHRRVDHARAAQLDPAAVLAQVAAEALSHAVAGLAAKRALHVELGPGLDEGEEARPKADLQLVTEERRDEVVERGLEVGHGHAAVDVEPLDLVEHR